jgi:hypothetical protein
MPKKEQIQKIIDRLVEGTDNGSVIWKLSTSCFNSETTHKYSTTTEDGKTTFNFEIHLNQNFQPDTSWCYLYMYNSDLIDGKIQIAHSDYKDLDKLQFIIYNKWIKSTLTIKNENKVLDDIVITIGDKQKRRDRVLDEILGENTSPIQEKKSDQGIWSKIFKKK